MKDYLAILKPAKAALILLVSLMASELFAVFGMAQYRTADEQNIKQTENKLFSMRDDIRKLTYDLNSINELAEKYQHLKSIGFIGEPDRNVWLQGLEATYNGTLLPPNLRYTLVAPQLLNQQPASNKALNYQNNVLQHDIVMELSGIHDGEFLDFMGRLGANWKAPFRVEACQITRETEVLTGLQIKCTLRIFSLPVKTEKAGS